VSAAHEVSHVVYIVGWGRSGSTLLTAVLGELDGAFAAGELRMLWGRGAIGRRLCGCGRVIPECPIWSQVLERLDDAPCTAEEMARIQAQRLRSRHFLPELLRMALHRGPDEELSRYAATYVLALEAVTEVTGAKVVIDGSKNPIDALLLEHAGVDLRAINLVRDPRSVAASWSRRKRLDDGDDAELRRFTPWSSSVLWSLWNALAHLVGRGGERPRATVRFETFLDDPDAEIDRLAALCGLPRDDLKLEGRCVHLSPNHLVAGNGDRFRTGDVMIKPRDTARLERRKDAILSSIASFPLTVRFRYRVFRHRDGA
jgi:sulfotransferase family protein